MFGHDKENKKKVEAAAQQQTTQTTQTSATGAANTAENAYQTGYYRSVPHQDEPIYSNQASYQNQTQSKDGSYSYANYCSNPTETSGKQTKKKKKHTGLKVVALVAALAIVSAGSIQAYRYVTPFFDKDSSSSDYQASSKKDSSASSNGATAETTQSKSDSKSWIELASGGEAKSVTDIVSKVMPSVVGVQSTFTYNGATNNSNSGFGYGFGYGFGNGGSDNSSSQTMTGTGTGIIMSEDGYIVTNSHVIYDDEYGCGVATKVEIVLEDQETYYDAKVVAYDQESDIAVLKTDLTGLQPAEFGDSDNLQVGELVVAIGNPFGFELFDTVTCGIVSALNRQVTINDKAMTLIQTDTAINSGNSGGPLINSAGQVIGINSAKMSSSYSSNSASIEGIGFAIPITEAKEIINDLINYGYVTGRPQLGITCQDVSESVSQAYNMPIGAYIISVSEGGAAAKAGLKTGDVITGIEGQDIKTTEELNNIKNEYNAGDTVTLTIVRDGKTMDVKVELQEVTNQN